MTRTQRAWGGRVLVPWTVALCVPLGAYAQAGPTSMGQGEALINVRSDVKLGIKGTGGTTSEHLQQFADAIATRMVDVRACYGKLVAQRPATVGALAVRMTLDRGVRSPMLEVKEKEGSDPELSACVRKHLAQGSFEQVGRPAAVIVTLEFQNSRAQGQAAMQEHRAKADVMPVRASGDGFEVTWARNNGDVSFTVRGTSAPAVESVARDFRDHVALWVDCRRRASKGTQSPAGVIRLDVRIEAGGALDATLRAAPTEGIGRCIDKTLKGRTAVNAPAGQRVSAEITFAP